MNTTIVIILINIVLWVSLIGMIINLQINIVINSVLILAVTTVTMLGGTLMACKLFYYFSDKKDLKKKINERKKIYNSNGQITPEIKSDAE